MSNKHKNRGNAGSTPEPTAEELAALESTAEEMLAEATEATAPEPEPKAPEPKKTVHFFLEPTMDSIFKVFDQPKQVRDICRILLTGGEMSEAELLKAMAEGGIKTRQPAERILGYYLKALTNEVGVSVTTK